MNISPLTMILLLVAALVAGKTLLPNIQLQDGENKKGGLTFSKLSS